MKNPFWRKKNRAKKKPGFFNGLKRGVSRLHSGINRASHEMSREFFAEITDYFEQISMEEATEHDFSSVLQQHIADSLDITRTNRRNPKFQGKKFIFEMSKIMEGHDHQVVLVIDPRQENWIVSLQLKIGDKIQTGVQKEYRIKP